MLRMPMILAAGLLIATPALGQSIVILGDKAPSPTSPPNDVVTRDGSTQGINPRTGEAVIFDAKPTRRADGAAQFGEESLTISPGRTTRPD